MHELQSLLLQKLPRLGELTFGCEVKFPDGNAIILKRHTDMVGEVYELVGVPYASFEKGSFEILGHPFTHADILEALGEDWAMQSNGQLLYFDWDIEARRWRTVDKFENPLPKLPFNLSALSLPEYEETRKQLIQLLTK